MFFICLKYFNAKKVHNALLKLPFLEQFGNELFCSTEIFPDRQRQLLSTMLLFFFFF